MIFQESVFTENGDQIIFQSVPLSGLTSITSYSDSTTGEDANSVLIRNFAISFDGVVFTPYFQLTNENLVAQINPILSGKTQIILKFNYQLVSTETSPQVTLLALNLNGTYTQPTVNYPISSRSVYKHLVYDDIDVHNLMVNLAEKMYQRGIVPEYIVRAEGGTDIFADKDYIEFWSIVAKFFSIFLIDAFKFSNIYFKYQLLSAFLNQKGIFFNKKNTLIDLQLIAKNFYDEIRQRGSENIFRAKGYEYFYGSRNVYQIPTGYTIQPSTPVMIDGIVYKEINQLPFGWTVQNNLFGTNILVAPDVNFHRVVFDSIDSGGLGNISGDFNDDFNDDFLIGSNTTGPTQPFEVIPSTADSEVYKQYDGEYLRLIGYLPNDEILFNQVSLKFLGWFIGSGSPCYKGLRAQYNKEIIKAYEPSEDFFDLENFPIYT